MAAPITATRYTIDDTGRLQPVDAATQAVPTRLAHSPAETAELLGISRMQVYRLLDAGHLRSQKIGRARRVLRSQMRLT